MQKSIKLTKLIETKNQLNESIVEDLNNQYKVISDLRKTANAEIQKISKQYNDEVEKYYKTLSSALDEELQDLKSALTKIYPKATLTPTNTGFNVRVKTKEDKHGDHYFVNDKDTLGDNLSVIKRNIQKNLKGNGIVNISNPYWGAMKGADEYSEYYTLDADFAKNYINSIVTIKPIQALEVPLKLPKK